MEQGNQPVGRHPCDPLEVLREYLQERQIKPYISCCRSPNMLWDCRLTCGPYIVHGSSFDQEDSITRAAKAMLDIFNEIRQFPKVDLSTGMSAEKLNRYYAQQALTRIENKIIGIRHWWNDACVILLREELAHLLRVQGVEIIETVQPRQTDTLIIWEITSTPRILTTVTGQTPERIRFHLLLDSINNLRIRLYEVEKRELRQSTQVVMNPRIEQEGNRNYQ